jgi:hypothetical protein
MTVFALKYIAILYLSMASLPKDAKPPFKMKESPPGTVWLKDSVFIDVNPVKNIDYKEFLSFMQVAYSKELRDSFKNIPPYGISMENFRTYMRLCGIDKDLASKMKIPYEMTLSWSMNMDEYLNSPTYKNFPVVNASYNQAIMYCQWRTDMVMLFYSANSKNEKQRRKYYKKIRYRLPTPEEWAYAMVKFGNNTFTNQAVYAGEKCATIEAVPQKKNLDFVYIPYNVAELTNTDKLAVGMSWKDKDTTTNYSKTVEYFGPRDWLGFRCVCEIVEY